MSVVIEKFDSGGGDWGSFQKEVGSGINEQCCMNNDAASVKFPVKTNARTRATMLGALLLLDVNFYESTTDAKGAGDF